MLIKMNNDTIIFVSKNDENFEYYKAYIKTSHDICATSKDEGVSRAYIKNHALKNADVFALSFKENYKTRSKTLKTLQGFAILQIKPDHLYIDVICAKKKGDIILSNVYKFGNILNKKYVILNALPHVINYYKRPKHSFLHGYKQCVEEPSIKKLGNTMKNKKFNSSSDALSNTNFKKLLSMLIKKKLTHNKQCKNIQSCSKDGYTMTKCLKKN